MNLSTARMQPFTRVRSSALMAAERCDSRALFRYSLGIIPPGDDLAQQGTDVHDLLEQWSAYGTDPSVSAKKLPLKAKAAERLATIARSLLRNIPKPPIDPALVEHKYEDQTTYPGFTYHGTIDLVHPEYIQLPSGEWALVITDHKTTSSFLWFLSEEKRNELEAIADTRISKTIENRGLAVYYEMRKIAEEEMSDWHIHSEAYLRTSIQANAYTCEAERSTGWKGPIVFRWNIGQRRKPYPSRVVSTVFTHADRQAARKSIHARMRLLLSYSLRDSISEVPYNLDACEDYKSHRNPMGCKFRAHCAALGRPTMGEFSRLLHQAQDRKKMGSIDDILGAAIGVPGNGNSPDPLGLTTGGANPDPLGLALGTPPVSGLTPGMRTIQQFDPAWTDASLQEMDAAEIEELRAITLATKAPVERLSTEDLHAAIVHFMPHITIEKLASAGYSPDQLQRTLTAARATASTASGQINPPDGPAAKAPPAPLPVKGKKAKTGTAGNARGQRMPEEYGGDLVGRTDKPTILRWLADNGHTLTPQMRYSNKKAQTFIARRLALIPFDPTHADDAESRITPAGGSAPAPAALPALHPNGMPVQKTKSSAFAINPANWPHSTTIAAGSGTSEDRSIVTQTIVGKRPDVGIAKLIGMDLRSLLSVYEQYCGETTNVRTSDDRGSVIALILGHRKDLGDADLASYSDAQLIAYLATLNEKAAAERAENGPEPESGIAASTLEAIRALCETHDLSVDEIGSVIVISA